MAHVTRREFLKGSLALAALSAVRLEALPAPQGLGAPGKPKRVVIVGAGLAGLVAGYELFHAGHDVTLLEAQLRPGGRVLTLREPFSDGLYAEAGAARILDTHDLVLGYAKKFGLAVETFLPSSGAGVFWVRGQRIVPQPGKPVEWPYHLTPEEAKLGQGGIWQKHVVDVAKTLGDPAAPGWSPAAFLKYDGARFLDYLRQQGLSPDAVALETLGWDFDDASALTLLEDFAVNARARKLFKIRNGNDLLPRAFAAPLAERIRYGAPVLRIEPGLDKVRVVFLAGGRTDRLEADRLICAIPFSVLRHVVVTPAFSPAKTRAIEGLDYLPAARICLQMRQRFWTGAGLNGFGLSDWPSQIWQPTFDQPGPRGLLVQYLTGALARRVGTMSEGERLRLGLAEMEKLFPGATASYEGGATKSWDEDPWARGGWTWFRPGEMSAFWPFLAQAEGRVHFAGEHTSPWPAWMQGAVHSGRRAAREVNEAAS